MDEECMSWGGSGTLAIPSSKVLRQTLIDEEWKYLIIPIQHIILWWEIQQKYFAEIWNRY